MADKNTKAEPQEQIEQLASISCTISYRGKYSDACKCIEELKEAGLDAGITVGGIWVIAENAAQCLKGQEIATRYEATLSTELLTDMQRWQMGRWEEKRNKKGEKSK